LLINKWRTVNS